MRKTSSSEEQFDKPTATSSISGISSGRAVKGDVQRKRGREISAATEKQAQASLITGRNSEPQPTEPSRGAKNDGNEKKERPFLKSQAQKSRAEEHSVTAEQTHGPSHLASTYTSHADLISSRKKLKDKSKPLLPVNPSSSGTGVAVIGTSDGTSTTTSHMRSGVDTRSLYPSNASPSSLISSKAVDDSNDHSAPPSSASTGATLEPSGSFNFDTEQIRQIQKLTDERTIGDVLQRLRRFIVEPTDPLESLNTTTSTLPTGRTTIVSATEETSPSTTVLHKKNQHSVVSSTRTVTGELGTSMNGKKKQEETTPEGRHRSGYKMAKEFFNMKNKRERTSEGSGDSDEHCNRCSPYRLSQVVFLAALMAVILFLFSALVLLPRLSRYRRPQSRKGHSLDAASVCHNTACHRALTFLRQPMDADVDPCKDFYRHVCGRWRADKSARLSYAAENHHNFLVSIHRALKRMVTGADASGASVPCPGASRMMADFYVSCLHFARHPPTLSLRRILLQIGIDPVAWLRPSTFQELVSRVVNACLRTGLTSVISVRPGITNQNIFVDIGETIRHSTEDPENDQTATDNARVLLVTTALSELQLNLSVKSITELDAAMELLRSESWKSPHAELFKTVLVKDLPHPLEGLSWDTIVEAAPDNETSAGAVKVPHLFHVRRLTEVRAILSLLGSTSLQSASLYTLLLPVAQVVRFVPAHLGARGTDRDDLVLPTCLRATESRFPDHFPLWVSTTLETTRARLRLDEMVAAIKGVLKAPVAGGGNIARMNSSGTSAEFIVSPTGSLNGNVTACGDDKNVSVARLSSEDFIGNVILLSRQTRFVDSTEESWRGTQGIAHGQVHQVLGAIDFHNGTLVVPSLYLAEDLMNVGASEPCLDMPTVGVPLLAAWAQGALSGGQEQSERFVSSCQGCLPQERDHAMAANEIKNGSTDAYLVNSLLVPWAAKLALAACTAMKRNTGELETKAFSTGPWTTESVRDTPEAKAEVEAQLFFQRLCLMTCGDSAAASAWNCIARLPEFRAAFKCTT